MRNKFLGMLGLVVSVSPVAISISCGGHSVGESQTQISEEILNLREEAKSKLPSLPTQPDADATQPTKDHYNQLLNAWKGAIDKIDNAISEEEINNTLTEAKSICDGALNKWQEEPAHLNISPMASVNGLVISGPTTIKITQGSINQQIWDKVAQSSPNENPWDDEYESYSVKLPGTEHIIKFNIDKGVHMGKDIAHELINRFAAQVNYGYGILTLKSVIFTQRSMSGTVGWGGAGEDIIIQAKDLKDASLHSINFDIEMQQELVTLFHEYGHHETTALIDKTGAKQAKDLVDNNVIGAQMRTNALADSDAEETRLMNTMTGKTLEGEFSWLLGAPDIYNQNFAVAKYDFGGNIGSHSGTFNAGYDLKVDMEFLNRSVNIFELMPWNDNNKSTLYMFYDLYKYQLGESTPFINKDKTYSDKAKELLALYGKFVYGYSSYGLILKANYVQGEHYGQSELKGFTSVDFDTIKVKAFGDPDYGSPVQVESVVSHYMTKNTFLGQSTVLNNSLAYHAWIETPRNGATIGFFKNGTLVDHQDYSFNTNYAK